MTPGNQQNNGMIVPIVLGGVFIVVGGFLISLLTPAIFPAQASAEAGQIDTLFQVMLGIGGAIFLLVQGLLLYSIIAFRRKDGDDEDGPTIHGNTTLELVWTAIPAVIVIFLVIYSYAVWVDIRAEEDNEMVVEAIGARYAWSFRYEDDRLDTLAADGEDAPQVASNVLHFYDGQPVRMVLNTEDVIHSFWLPEMRIKQDLLPGRTTEIPFTPQFVEGEAIEDENGLRYNEYRLVCAELCGAGHGDMFAPVRIYETEEMFNQAFLDPAVDLILNPPPDPALRGAQLIQNYACAGCHVLQDPDAGIDWNGNVGPPMNGIGDRAGTRVPGQTAEQYLYNSIYYPQTFYAPGYEGVVMNQFQPDDPAAANYMPTEDVYAIVAYLCSLNSAEESACDLDNLLTVINTDKPDLAVQPMTAAEEVEGGMADPDAAGAETTPEPGAEMTEEPPAAGESEEGAEETPEPAAGQSAAMENNS